MRISRTFIGAACAILFASAGLIEAPLRAQASQNGNKTPPQFTYADLADLADSADLVVRAKVTRQAEVEPERSPGLAAGMVRLYIEAETLSLLAGNVSIGQSIRYLVDLPRDEKGRAPKLKRREFILFAQQVAGRPGEIQLTDSQAQLPWTPDIDSRLRPILADLYAADALPGIEGIRDALSVEGNLAGESETQVFLATRDNSPLSITVIRRPGMRPVWGYSQSEIVDQSASRPQPDTIAWYRLACSLPRSLPADANLAVDGRSQQRALADYAYVIEELGPCLRNRS